MAYLSSRASRSPRAEESVTAWIVSEKREKWKCSRESVAWYSYTTTTLRLCVCVRGCVWPWGAAPFTLVCYFIRNSVSVGCGSLRWIKLALVVEAFMQKSVFDKFLVSTKKIRSLGFLLIKILPSLLRVSSRFAFWIVKISFHIML